MTQVIRIATFNLENLDDGPNVKPPLRDRMRVLRPQLERLRADILCLQGGAVLQRPACGACDFTDSSRKHPGMLSEAPGRFRKRGPYTCVAPFSGEEAATSNPIMQTPG